MLGKGTQWEKVGCESLSLLQNGLHFQADTAKPSAPERTQKGAGFEIFLSLLEILNVRAQDETSEAEGCRGNGFIPCLLCTCTHMCTHTQ